MAAKWTELSSFSLTDVQLPTLGTAIVAQLSKGNWSSLQSLSLPQCRLNAQGVLLLTHGKWPALRIYMYPTMG